MPGAMDQIETVRLIKFEIHKLDSDAHNEIARQPADPKGCSLSTRATEVRKGTKIDE